MIFTLARVRSAANSSYSEFRRPDGSIIARALERGKDMPDHPRIPPGVYEMRFRRAPSKFDSSFRALLGDCFRGVIEICNVPKRFNIEIHTANRWDQLEGCIAPGETVEADGDGEFFIPGGQSSPEFKTLYLALAPAVIAGAAVLAVVDQDGGG